MKEFEIIMETVNPCGGEQYAIREVFEAEAESPEAYVREHGQYPIISVEQLNAHDTRIITGGGGYTVRYTFSE